MAEQLALQALKIINPPQSQRFKITDNLFDVSLNPPCFLWYLSPHCILHMNHTIIQGLIGQTKLTPGACNRQGTSK